MPKKRTNLILKPIPPSTPKPIASSSRTVNERLAQLRAEQAPRATLQQRNEIATIATAHTLPPHLRRLLDIPETPPPGPKPGARRIFRINGRRLPPGPAAPQSWLAGSIHAPRNTKSSIRSRDRPDGFSRLAVLGEAHELPAPGTLLDQTLKAMAAHWDFIVEYEQLNLGTLPIHWKSALLSYLSVYGPEEGVSSADLKTLFMTEDELPDATGGEDLVRLDLTGLITEHFPVETLEKLLYRKASLPEASLDALSLEPSTITIAESWEDNNVLPFSPGLKIPRFPNLTRLSLAHTPTSLASWSALLSLSTNLSQLTHLSLAYWPAPTTTPNSKTAFISHNHASIPLSGTHFYAHDLDNDYAEAANILKRLSNATYRLQWLDLEGCTEWVQALTWSGDAVGDRWVDRTFRRGASPSPSPSPSARSTPYWTGSWAQVSYLNLSQGTIPNSVASIRSIPASVMATELLLYLRDQESEGSEGSVEGQAMTRPEVQKWLEREKVARNVGMAIRLQRRSWGGTFCKVDHGWERPVAAAAAVLGKGKKTVTIGEAQATQPS